MIHLYHYFILLFSYVTVSCSISFEDFTELAVSLELLTGHLVYLKNKNKNMRFKDELKKLSEEIYAFKQMFYVPEIMRLYCGKYVDESDELYRDLINCYQVQQINPWIVSIRYDLIDTSFLSKNLVDLIGTERKSLRKQFILRNEIRKAIDSGRLRFKYVAENNYLNYIKQALGKYVIQEITRQVENRIFKAVGEIVEFQNIKNRLETNFCFNSKISSVQEAKNIYNQLPEIEFKLKQCDLC